MRMLFLPFVLLIGLAGCSSSEDMKKAEAAVELFHKELDDGAFDRIYNESSDAMKAKTSQEKLVKFLSAIHRKLGNFQSDSSTGWNVTAGTNGTIITLGYTSTYEQGKAEETFVFRTVDGKAILEGYNVNSTDLIVN